MSVPVPTNVAYLTVRISAKVNGSNPLFNEDAERIVTNYLYQGTIVGTDLDWDDDVYLVLVRIEGYSSEVALMRTIQIQRDRFASGLIFCTEPQILTIATS